jgi:subtilisin family serine protease
MKNYHLKMLILPVLLLLILSNTGSAVGQNNRTEDEGGLANEYVHGELLVKFKAGTKEVLKQNVHKKQGSQKIKEFPRLNIHHVKLREGVSVEDVLEEFRADPSVEYAEPNYIVSISIIPNDPLFNTLWGLYNTGQNGGVPGADINMVPAWDITTGRNDVVVAVIDTGLDYNHPDLFGNVWANQAEDSGIAYLDDDGNHYVDDIFGIDPFNQTSDPVDDNGHGTHVAGTIGAANNGIGVVGINWNVKIMACKFLSSGGWGYTSDAIECLEYVRAMKERGVNVVATNNSWGGVSYSQSLYDAIDAQRQDGILFIAAAGNSAYDNDTSPFYPADFNLPNVISTAATDRYDARAWFSNYGRRTVHVGAPGMDIVSLRATGTDMYGHGLNFIPPGDPNAAYYIASGTSMAAPHVTGLAALIKSQDMTRDWRAIKNLIISGGENTSSMEGITITGKRCSAYGSLNCVNSPVFSALEYPWTISAGVPVTVSALSINCALPLGPVTMTSSSGETIGLYDAGVAPDLAAGDGIFATAWTPSGSEHYITISSPLGTEKIGYPVTIVTDTLPDGSRDVPYSQTIQVSGGFPPYTWSVTSGSLPTGLTLDGLSGVISGTPLSGGTFDFTLQARDSQADEDSKPFRIIVHDLVFPITATAGSGGSISPAGIKWVYRDGSQTYMITPYKGYYVEEVLVDGGSVGAVTTYTFTNVTSPHTISASFGLNPTVTITASAGPNGTISPFGSVPVVMGMSQSFSITPLAGYGVTGVVVDGVSIGARSGYTFSNVQTAHTISASFGPTIKATAGTGGSISPLGTSYLTNGDDKTYTIRPNTGYHIADVLVDGGSVGAVTTYTFTNVTSPHTISASFGLNPTVTITASAGPNGTISPFGSVPVVMGMSQSFSITPLAGYGVTGVVVDNVSIGPRSAYTFSNVQAPHSISASFGPTIKATAGTGGSISPSGTSILTSGANKTYTIKPKTGYHIMDVLVDGGSVGAVTTYTFTNVTSPHTISASFGLNPTVTITASAGPNGTISPFGSVPVVMGMSQSFSITPLAGYGVTGVVVDGVSIGARSGYTFSNVQTAHTISASFGPTIKATAGTGGSISPLGTSYLTNGDDKTYTIRPNTGYHIADVLVDGGSVGAVTTYTFTNVTSPHTISASFGLNPTVTITASAGPNGTISPFGSVPVVMGMSQSFSITPLAGYGVTGVVVDNVSIGPRSAYTFSNVQAPHSISASFGPTIKATAGTGGSISPSGTSILTSGANKTYTIKPKTGYHIMDVLVDGSSVGAVTTYTFTNVTTPHTISATFALN